MRCTLLRTAHLARLVGLLGLVSCHGAAKSSANAQVSATRPDVAPPLGPEAVSASAPTPASEARACGFPPEVTAERLELTVNTSQRTASGMTVHFVGSSDDHYEDGGFDRLAEVHFSWGDEETTELVSVLAPVDDEAGRRSFRSALDHCWRLVEFREDRVVVEVLADAPDGRRLPSCDERPPPSEPLPIFDSYRQVADGARFRAVIEYDVAGHAWAVVPTPTILRHHGTRIEWANLVELGHAGLGLARGRPVQITLRFTSSTIDKIPGERRWRSEHVAVIESACIPDAG